MSYKHNPKEIEQRIPVIRSYIDVKGEDLKELIKNRSNTDVCRQILVKNAREDWVDNILDVYDPVVTQLTELIISENKSTEKQLSLEEAGLKRAPESQVEPEKNRKIKSKTKEGKEYYRTKGGSYENKKSTILFVKNRSELSNIKLTEQYNAWAMSKGYKLRTISGIATLKSRINTGKYR